MTASVANGSSTVSDSMAERAYHTLRDHLVLLDIAPGAPMAEAALSQQIGVGRTPLREALKRLEADHLVVTYARRGTFATSVDLTELAEISEIRKVLVPLAARRGAVHRGGAARADLEEVLSMLRGARPDDQRHLMEVDLRTHRLVNHASMSPHLEETLVRLDNLVTRMWCLMMDRLPPMTEHVDEHIGLIQAILDGDESQAEGLAAEHVDHFEAAFRSGL